MKPDKFDESIRRKLEGIQPSFQEDDWAKFTAYQAAHAPSSFSFIKQYGRALMYSAASVAAAVMVFANVYQYRQNKQLDQQLSQLKTTLAQKNDAPIRISHRVDTVYITKYIKVESSQNNQYDESVPSLNDVSPNEVLTNNTQDVGESLRNVGKIIRQNPDQRISEVFEKQPSETENTTPKEAEKSEEEIVPNQENTILKNSVAPKNKRNLTTKEILSKSTNASSRSTTQNSNSGSANFKNNTGVFRKQREFVSSASNDLVANNTSVVTEAENTTAESTFDIMPLEHNSNLVELDGIEPAEAKVQRYAYAAVTAATAAVPSTTTTESKTTAPKLPPISFKNMKFRIGTGLNIGDKFTAYSANTSLLLGKFWSLDLGLSQAKITGPQFYTEDIFKAKTQKDFDSWNKNKGAVKPPLAPPQILDIKTSVSLWRMPISLTYRWPVKDGFSLLMSGGTNLNLSANQQYSYYIKERNGELEEKGGNFDITPSLSNDVVLAAGVEKQWRSLVLQAETYAAPYLQKPTYLTENRNIGIRVKVLYQFGKKQI
jgi:hypothetical protein